MDHMFQVTGMTCGRCVAHVEKAVRGVPGVNDLTVTLSTGNLLVNANADVPLDAIRQAVRSAGYEIE